MDIRNWWSRAADRTISRGLGRVVALVAITIAALTVVGTVIRQAAQEEGIGQSAWASFSRLIDPSSIQQEHGWDGRLTGILFIFIGIIASSLWIALVVTALQNGIERVRNGRSEIWVTPDTIILGWSSQISTVIRELAMGSEHHRSIAILCDLQRVDAEERLRRECGDALAHVTVHCRTGDRGDPRDLELVKVRDAARIIIFGEPSDRDDSAVVRSVFAVFTTELAAETMVVAEVCDHDVALSLDQVFSGRILTVNSNEILALVLAQSCREQGMGQLFDQLTSYKGGELYQRPLPHSMAGLTFGEVAWRTENCCPIGYIREGRPRVLPHFDEVLTAGDHLVAVDRRHQPILISEDRPPHGGGWASPEPPTWARHNVGVVGWNHIFDRAARHLRGFIDPSSTLTVFADRSSMSAAEISSLKDANHIDDVRWVGSGSSQLQSLRANVGADESLDTLAIVPYRDDLTPSQSDAVTLSTLAVGRSAIGDSDCRIVAELRETRSASLTSLLRPDDLLLSDAVTAALVAQLIDRPWLDGVLADLLDFHGSALFIVPPRSRGIAMDTDRPLDFVAARRAVMEKGELLVGVRVGASIELNPDEHHSIADGDVTGLVLVGAGLGWGTNNAQHRVAGLTWN